MPDGVQKSYSISYNMVGEPCAKPWKQQAKKETRVPSIKAQQKAALPQWLRPSSFSDLLASGRSWDGPAVQTIRTRAKCRHPTRCSDRHLPLFGTD